MILYLRTQKRTSELLSKGNISDKPSQYVNVILFILILLNVTAVCLTSLKNIGEAYKNDFYAFGIFSLIIFSIEYLLRVWPAPARPDLGKSSSFVKRLKYIFSFIGLVDFLAIMRNSSNLFYCSCFNHN